MTDSMLTPDYLIVGAGAMGMAFADVVLTESDATVVMVDRHHAPGGHWNDAYPFVTLHQPSAYYGVSSRELGRNTIDRVGLNQGLYDLASGAEVLAYFDAVMREQFLPTGRVTYFPGCDYLGDGRFRSVLSGEERQVRPKLKTVDCTFLKTTVPSTHTPNFEFEAGARFITINQLVKTPAPPAGYVIVGGGKTGIDSVLWLLEQGVSPDAIQWIMPRDAWLINRETTQPGTQFFEQSMGAQAAQMEAIAAATSVDDLFHRLAAAGNLLRIDESVEPEMFHAATVSPAEIEALRRVTRIIRKGRVTRLGLNEIELEQGRVATSPEHLHVDCSASALKALPVQPIFQGDRIVPQMVRSFQPVFSAALIAHVELTRSGDDEKNELCGPVPLPDRLVDWLPMTAAFMMNQYKWSQDDELRGWLASNRLDGFSGSRAAVAKDDETKRAILKRLSEAAIPAMGNLQKLMVENPA
ncbi:MAG: NAD(P)-binding protein [Pseudomonadota bacterium]